jgi:hypothetical protein
MEGHVADRTLPQFAARIDTRLADTTETVSRIERFVGASLRELAAGLSARTTEVEETLRRIERVIEAGSARWVGERNQQWSPDAEAVQRGSARAWMATAKSVRAVQHRGVHVWAVVTKRARLAHDVTAPLRIAAMSGVDLPRLARRFAAAFVLLCVLAVVSVRFNDPMPGLRAGSVEGRREIIPSSKLTFATTPPVIIPAVEAVPPLATTIQWAGTRSPAVVVAKPTRRAVIPDPGSQTALDEVALKQDGAPGQFVGTLEVTSDPAGASVFVNGRRAGVTPLKLDRQRAGSLALQLTREGYERWSASIQVPANRVTQVAATLRRPRP